MRLTELIHNEGGESMLIKKITLRNFRQYMNTEISFSTDLEKNVTLIKGDNGTGKTTLAQAFQWVLYGHTNFQIRELINRKAKENANPNDEVILCVILELEYAKEDYILKRSITYKKTKSDFIEKNDGSYFTIAKKNKNGNNEYISESQKNYIVKQILPEDLSKFFFFDGERIETLAKELSGGKSKEFKEAVYGLVGLRATQNAIRHLGDSRGGRKNVIKIFQNEIDKNNKSNHEMEQYQKRYDANENSINSKEKELEAKKMAHSESSNRISTYEEIIERETPQLKLNERYKQLESKIEKTKKEKIDSIYKDFLPSITTGFYAYIMNPLVRQAEPYLKDDLGKDKCIPGVTKKLLNVLLERHMCLCGSCLEEGNSAYSKIIEQFEYAYPKTIGMLIEDFEKTKKYLSTDDFFEIITRRIKQIEKYDAEIEGSEQEKDEIYSQRGKSNEGETAKKKLEEEKQNNTILNRAIGRIEEEISALKREQKEIINQKSNLIITTKDTEKNQRYLAYAKRLYDDMNEHYRNKEAHYKSELQKRMNTIFADIYDSDIQIYIDDQYRISVNVIEDKSNDDIERNTAQGYALVFAFIAAIIDLSKEKAYENALGTNEEYTDIEHEGYPLVMDAPLSAFDKTRIQKICTEIPKIANQVIMFIKDTDGEIAEMHMHNKIGNQYEINQVNDSKLHSTIIPVCESRKGDNEYDV